MARLLLIDDDAQLAPPLAQYLRRFGFELQAAIAPSAGLALLANGHYDAAILDVMLPEMDGFELCRTIRRSPEFGDLPILMLTARGEVTDRIVGLEIGADDYLPKPFEPRELAARLQTILRRRRSDAGAAAPAAPPGSAPLRFDGLAIDLERRSVHRQGLAVDLTGTEFELLVLLARAPHKVFTRDQILAHLRGQQAELLTRAVDLLVSRLRRKLAPLDCIKTLRNAGYLFALGREPRTPGAAAGDAR